MPQMFPTNWLFLFYMFSLLLLIVYKKLYHSLNQPQLILPMIFPNNPTSWSW